MLISSDDPDGVIYLPEKKWGLFNERIRVKGSALWGLNTGEPKGISPPFWIYVHEKGSGKTQYRMHAIGYEYFSEKRALSNDERRIPRFKEQKFKLFLEIDKIEKLEIS